MRNTILGICVVAIVALSPYAASATKIVQINGTFSKGQAAKDCAAVGGVSNSSAANGEHC
jgi:hypothetical protein